LSHCSHNFAMPQKYYIPDENISVDEMIVRFSGRSAHTVRMKSKPTPEGYKIYALCDRGYTCTFLPTSQIRENCEVMRIEGINKTGEIIIHLVTQLPGRGRSFNIFMDNFFSSIALYKWFRENGVGACGTVRISSKDFPRALQFGKGTRMDWNVQSAVDIDGVLAFFWMDNGPVTMLSTIHGVGDGWEVVRNRRRPRESSKNATKVREVFGSAARKELAIPK
jgi:Transposase IS4